MMKSFSNFLLLTILIIIIISPQAKSFVLQEYLTWIIGESSTSDVAIHDVCFVNFNTRYFEDVYDEIYGKVYGNAVLNFNSGNLTSSEVFRKCSMFVINVREANRVRVFIRTCNLHVCII